MMMNDAASDGDGVRSGNAVMIGTDINDGSNRESEGDSLDDATTSSTATAAEGPVAATDQAAAAATTVEHFQSSPQRLGTADADADDTGASTSAHSQHYSPKSRWSVHEEQALLCAVELYGEGHWSYILEHDAYAQDLCQRSNVDLKDKWRNMKRQMLLEHQEQLQQIQRQYHEMDKSSYNQGTNVTIGGQEITAPAAVKSPTMTKISSSAAPIVARCNNNHPSIATRSLLLSPQLILPSSSTSPLRQEQKNATMSNGMNNTAAASAASPTTAKETTDQNRQFNNTSSNRRRVQTISAYQSFTAHFLEQQQQQGRSLQINTSNNHFNNKNDPMEYFRNYDRQKRRMQQKKKKTARKRNGCGYNNLNNNNLGEDLQCRHDNDTLDTVNNNNHKNASDIAHGNNDIVAPDQESFRQEINLHLDAFYDINEEFALVCNLVPLQRVVKRYQILEQELRRTCHEYFFSTETSMLNLEKAHHHQIDENGMHNGLNDNMNTIINGLPPQPPTSSPRRNPGSSKEYIAPTSPFSPSSRKQSLSPSKQKYGIMSPDSLGANVIAAIIAPANHDGTANDVVRQQFFTTSPHDVAQSPRRGRRRVTDNSNDSSSKERRKKRERTPVPPLKPDRLRPRNPVHYNA